MSRLGQTHFGLITALIALFPAARVRADLGVPISDPIPLNSNATTDSSYDLRPALATDGLGHWVAVWTSRLDSLHDDEIFVARSLDNGDHWSNPVPLNNNNATDTASDQEPQIATDGQGHWVVVWQSFDTPGSPLGNDEDILVARSSDNGATWTDPAPLNDYAATDDGLSNDIAPRIAVDGLGHWVTVWQSNHALGSIGTDGDILFSRSLDNGMTWSPAAPLNTNAATDSGRDSEPFIAMNSQGVCVVAWSSNDTLGNTIGSDNDILVARSLDGGAHWSIPIPLNANAGSDNMANDYVPRLALDDDGHCVAIWESTAIPAQPAQPSQRTVNTFILTARSLDNGAHWSLPVPLNGDYAGTSGYGTYPTIATDRQGNWVAVWENVNFQDPANQDGDLFVVRSADNGANWSSPSVLNTNAATDTGGDTSPDLVTDRHGNWVTVWQSSGGALGGDVDALVARFALPDCNQNLIADSTETLLGLLPDINNNHIPDICEVIEATPPTTQTGCGGGLCGAGAATAVPCLLLSITRMRRSARRRRSR